MKSMPNNENEKKYVFDQCYENRLRTILQKSNGLQINSIRDTRFATTGAGEREETIIEITIHKAQLPAYCKLELIKDVLNSLEKYPDNIKLLEKIANYTNGPSEWQTPLWIGAGLVLGAVLFGIIPSLIFLSLICAGGYLLIKEREDNLLLLARDCKIEQPVTEAGNRQTLAPPCKDKPLTQAFVAYPALYANAKAIAQDAASNTQDNASETQQMASKRI